jgi:hypothetical protein
MMDLCGRAVQKLARAWKDDSEILPWLKQLATSNDDGLCAGAPCRKAPKIRFFGGGFRHQSLHYRKY